MLAQCTQADLYISPTTHKIISPQSHFYTSHLLPTRTIDLAGNLLSPGLIDVQINGAYGVDFSELALSDEDGGEKRYGEGVEKVSRRIVETGCTSFVPTIITQKEELYSKVCPPLDRRFLFGLKLPSDSSYDYSDPDPQPARQTS